MKYKKIVIGFDQSYTGTGITIAADNKPLKVSSTQFKGLKMRYDKRQHIRVILRKLLEQAIKLAPEVVILIERIGTYRASFGNKKNQGGTNPGYLKMTGALVATIVDTAQEFGINTYSVDTRSWKAQVVGSAKSRVTEGKRDSKGETVEFAEGMGYDMILRHKKSGKNKGDPIYDDDKADALCIALYGFIHKDKQKLQLEE